MAVNANFAATPIVASALVNTANTSRDGTGTIVTIYTAPTAGARIDRVIVKSQGTVSAGCVVLYLHDGTNFHVFDELVHGAVTASTTAASWSGESILTPFVLPNGWSIRASCTVAQAYRVTVIGGVF